MDKQLEYSISTWEGIKRSLPLFGQPNIKLSRHQLLMTINSINDINMSS